MPFELRPVIHFEPIFVDVSIKIRVFAGVCPIFPLRCQFDGFLSTHLERQLSVCVASCLDTVFPAIDQSSVFPPMPPSLNG